MLTKFHSFDLGKSSVKKNGKKNTVWMTVLTYKEREEIWDYLGIFHKHQTPPPSSPPFWEPLVKKTLLEAHRTQGIESIF